MSYCHLLKYKQSKALNDRREPKYGTRKDNHIEVWLNIINKATFNRKYSPLKVGDLVRVYIKPKTFKKSYDSSWSKDVYKITYISNEKKQFLVNDSSKRRVYSRHELLKIEGAEGKDG